MKIVSDKNHKGRGIINDATEWAIETVGKTHVSFALLQRVIVVRLETVKIVDVLLKL